MRRYTTVKILSRLVFEEIGLKLWNEYDRKLDEFINVLFLVYCARYRHDINEWLTAYANDSNSQVLPRFLSQRFERLCFILCCFGFRFEGYLCETL
jgi:hypothetical protein